MFALSCLRRSLVERNSTSRHPRANDFLRATVALALPVRANDLRTERSSEHRIILRRSWPADRDQGHRHANVDGFQRHEPDANPYADFNGSGSVTVRYLFGPAAGDVILACATSPAERRRGT